MPRPVTRRMLQALDRPPTTRELARLHQHLDQLAIAAPTFVTAIAAVVADLFGGLLKTGHVVPVTMRRRRA